MAAARLRANITQVDLAKRLRKPQSFVSNYERGQRRIDFLELCAIASILGLRPIVLISELLEALSSSGHAAPRKNPARSRP